MAEITRASTLGEGHVRGELDSESRETANRLPAGVGQRGRQTRLPGSSFLLYENVRGISRVQSSRRSAELVGGGSIMTRGRTSRNFFQSKRAFFRKSISWKPGLSLEALLGCRRKKSACVTMAIARCFEGERNFPERGEDPIVDRASCPIRIAPLGALSIRTCSVVNQFG